MPWLVGTALLHSLAVTEPRKCTKNVLRLQERIKRNKTVVYFMFVDVSGNKT
jgi:hypothetical protein